MAYAESPSKIYGFQALYRVIIGQEVYSGNTRQCIQIRMDEWKKVCQKGSILIGGNRYGRK